MCFRLLSERVRVTVRVRVRVRLTVRVRVRVRVRVKVNLFGTINKFVLCNLDVTLRFFSHDFTLPIGIQKVKG